MAAEAAKHKKIYDKALRQTLSAWYDIECDPCESPVTRLKSLKETYAELRKGCHVHLLDKWLGSEIRLDHVDIQGFYNRLSLGTKQSPLGMLDLHVKNFRLRSPLTFVNDTGSWQLPNEQPKPEALLHSNNNGDVGWLHIDDLESGWLDTKLEEAVEGVTIERPTKSLDIFTKSMLLETINPKTAALQLADEYEADISPKGVLRDGEIAIAAATLDSQGDASSLGYVIVLPNGSVQTITKVTGSSRPHQTMQNQGGRIKLFSNTKKLDNSKGGRLSEIEIDGGVEKDDGLGNVKIENPYIQIRSPRIELRGAEIEINSNWGLDVERPPENSVLVTPDVYPPPNVDPDYKPVTIWKTLTANHVGFNPPPNMPNAIDNVEKAIYEIETQLSGLASGVTYLGLFDAAGTPPTNSPDPDLTDPANHPTNVGDYYIAKSSAQLVLNPNITPAQTIQINSGDHVIWSVDDQGTNLWEVISGAVDLTAIETRLERLEGFHTTFPEISSQPKLTGSISGASKTMEAGTSITPTFTLNFNRGGIRNGDGSAGPDLVGPVNTWEGKAPGGSWEDIGGSTHTFGAYVLPKGSSRYDFRVNYDAGTGTYTEMSADGTSASSTRLDSQRVPGTKTWNYSINGRLFAWAGYGAVPASSADVRGLIKQSGYLDGNNRGSFTLSIPAGELQAVIVCPDGREPTEISFRESLGGTDIADQFVDSGTIAVNTGGGSGPTENYRIFVETKKAPYPFESTYDITIG